MNQRRFAWIVPAVYILLLMTPIYWLVSMSFKTNLEITTRFTLFPEGFTLDNYAKVFGDDRWRAVFANSLMYVSLNTVISVLVALPAAYAFSRYKFFGDKHLFFWLLTNRMAPAAVFTAAVLPALFGVRPVRYAHRRGAGALPVQRAAGGVDSRRFYVGRAPRDRRDRVHRRLLLPQPSS